MSRKQRAPALLPDLDLAGVADAAARRTVQQVLNVVEDLAQQVERLRGENQALRDELARLKGEQAKPIIRPAAPRPPANHSSEAARRTPTPRTARAKTALLVVDREQRLGCECATLPADARRKGYTRVLVQDLRVTRETVCFVREKWYAPSTGTTYLAPLPPGYQGQFGPHLRQLALTLYWEAQLSEASLLAFLRGAGVLISAGTLATLLTEEREVFAAEQTAVVVAGLGSSAVQQLDATSTRVNGQPQQCHILCSPFYTAYRTLPRKDRLSVLTVLSNGAALLHLANATAAAWLTQAGVTQATRTVLAALPQDAALDAAAFARLLEEHGAGLGPQQQRWLREATVVAAYQAGLLGPVVDTLLSDDAPEYARITRRHGLCWVHDGRHYTRLVPYTAANQRLLDAFRDEYWAFYRALRAYQAAPEPAEAAQLGAAFDVLFSRETGYRALDDRIAKTRAKRAQLLLVLTDPTVPLHNNAAELGARRRVRKRDVSYGPRTEQGKRAWDVFQTLVETTRKLGLSFAAYVWDRLVAAGEIPRLDALLRSQAAQAHAVPG